ncbi:MAG: hypothetical protein KBE91_02675 [Bacteroidia bacterium]|nr:hypothetical protein [Bacteroidia bacterium]
MAKKETLEFVNPLNEGVTYEAFLKAIPEGVTIKEYLKDFQESDIAWIETEIENYKQLKNK